MTNTMFEFQLLTEKDLPLLTDWLSRPHLQQWWREDVIIIEAVRTKYLPQIYGDDDARPYIVYLDDRPIGYIQYYHAWGNPNWWPDKPGKGVLGIDQFIADESQLDKGIGSKFIS